MAKVLIERAGGDPNERCKEFDKKNKQILDYNVLIGLLINRDLDGVNEMINLGADPTVTYFLLH